MQVEQQLLLSQQQAADDLSTNKIRAKRTPSEKRLRRISTRQLNPSWDKS